MEKKLKIGLMAASTAPIPDVLGGGAERLVTMLLDQNEVDRRVNFVVFSQFNQMARQYSRKYTNAEFVYIKRNTIFVKIYNAFVCIINKLTKKKILKKGYYDTISKWIRENPLDLAVDENGYVCEVGSVTKVLGKERIIAHIHWQVDPQRRGIDNLYGGVIGVSNFIKDAWISHSSDPSLAGMVVYSAVDEARFEKRLTSEKYIETRQHFGIGKDTMVFLYCGRLHEQKGVRELILAFQKVKNFNIRLLIVGGSSPDGKMTSYECELHKLALRDDRILFTGYISNEELYQFYQIADVQVIPTLVEEAAGLVAIEGMISGLPIIATNSGGLPEYISSDCAKIVDKNFSFTDQLASAIDQLSGDKILRESMSKEAKIRGRIFSQQRYYNDFIDCIENYVSSIFNA